MGKKKESKDLTQKSKGYTNQQTDYEGFMTPKHDQLLMRERGYGNTKIFLKTPEKDKSFEEIKKDKDKNDAKRRQAYNKALYRDRLKTKWDRGW